LRDLAPLLQPGQLFLGGAGDTDVCQLRSQRQFDSLAERDELKNQLISDCLTEIFLQVTLWF